MTIGNELLYQHTDRDKSSHRLRQNYDLHNSEDDGSQRMLNAIEPGAIIPFPRHANTSTTLVIIRGKIRQYFYDDSGTFTESLLINAEGENRCVQIERGRWHHLESLATILFEAKYGACESCEQFRKTK